MRLTSFIASILRRKKKWYFFSICLFLIALKWVEIPNGLLPIEKRRAVMVTLIRGSTDSVDLTINMIHSINHFYPFKDKKRYPFVIFHEKDLTSAMKKRILSCVTRAKNNLDISFTLVDFSTNVQPEKGSRPTKPIGYRMMCRFWSHDVFYHPTIRAFQYDYLLRMDDDSYFSGPIAEDFFDYMERKQLDYLYRAVYYEDMNVMQEALKQLNFSKSRVSNCIYNNFFVMRLQWFYQSKEIQRFLHKIIKDDLILRQYIGDGCAHEAMIRIANNTRAEHIKTFSYGHNFHIAPAGQAYWGFNALTHWRDLLKDSCQKLAIIGGSPVKLQQIKMS